MTMQSVLSANDAMYHDAVGKCARSYLISDSGVNGIWSIIVKKDAVNPETGKTWEWKVDGQYFSHEDWAAKYLVKIIAEKKTGERIIKHERRTVPEICGIEGAACRVEGRGYFTMLCSDCPVAEQMQAERDGVTLIYTNADDDLAN